MPLSRPNMRRERGIGADEASNARRLTLGDGCAVPTGTTANVIPSFAREVHNKRGAQERRLGTAVPRMATPLASSATEIIALSMLPSIQDILRSDESAAVGR